MAKHRRFKETYTWDMDIPLPTTQQELQELLNAAYNDGLSDGWQEGFYEGQHYAERPGFGAVD